MHVISNTPPRCRIIQALITMISGIHNPPPRPGAIKRYLQTKDPAATSYQPSAMKPSAVSQVKSNQVKSNREETCHFSGSCHCFLESTYLPA